VAAVAAEGWHTQRGHALGQAATDLPPAELQTACCGAASSLPALPAWPVNSPAGRAGSRQECQRRQAAARGPRRQAALPCRWQTLQGMADRQQLSNARSGARRLSTQDARTCHFRVVAPESPQGWPCSLRHHMERTYRQPGAGGAGAMAGPRGWQGAEAAAQLERAVSGLHGARRRNCDCDGEWAVFCPPGSRSC
jgi:hypothetical protein